MSNVTIKEDGSREVHYKLSEKGRASLQASAKKLHERQKEFYKKRGKTHVLYMYEDTHRMIYELRAKLGFRATLDSLINYSLKCVIENLPQFEGNAKNYIKSIAYASKKK